VQLLVYDALGRLVERLVDETLAPGYHRLRWDASGLPSGLYLYRLRAGDFVETRRMMLLK
jgi:hypothetical protein